MILIALAMAGQSPDPLPACVAAVHGNLADAVTACAVPKGQNIATADVQCSGALHAGQAAGQSAAVLTPEMRAGVVTDFDRQVAACRAPAPPGGRTTMERLGD